jgi:predicted Ser/Thr protein kinase
MVNLPFRQFLIAAVVLFAIPIAKADGPTPMSAEAFEAMFSDCNGVLGGGEATLDRYKHMATSWTLADLLTSDASKNLAVKYPTILMSNHQLNAFVKNLYPVRKVKDPAYQNRTYNYYPLISAGVPEAGGHQIIGHYGTIEAAMNVIDAMARGKRAGKMLGFVGPAGTGKTEILNLLNRAAGILSMTNENYYRFTFEFINLGKIPGLQALAYGNEEEESNPLTKDVSMRRSPFVLLPPSLQDKVLAMASDSFRAKTTFDPIPWRIPSGKTKEVVEAIVAYYQKLEKKETVSERDYIRYLSPHVKIIRRLYDAQQPTTIIRYLGKHPDMTSLFFTENFALSQYYGSKSALSYTYGTVPNADGEGVYVDELFRQAGDVRDTMLDLSQNATAQSGGAPPELIDATIMFATNDESIAQAMEDGGAKAHLDRTVRLPMRHALEPLHAIKIAMNDISKSKFKMRTVDTIPNRIDDSEKADELAKSAVSRATDDLVPYDPQAVIPDAEDGVPVGPDGHFALYYLPDSKGTPVLIAPRALWMMGLTAVGTRLVVDEKAYMKANEKVVQFHTFQKFRHYFTNITERLKVLTGQIHPERQIASELAKARDLMKEGQFGLGARELENWLSAALDMAAQKGGALTPAIADMAFADIIAKGKITVSAQDLPNWININNTVKAEFILPALSSDVVNILQGQGRAERVYDDIREELAAISSDPDATYVTADGSVRTPINRKRLAEIYKIFETLTGQSFDPGLIKDFHFRTSAANKRYPPLMEAVRRWMMEKELDKTTISELLEYFDGKPVGENVRLKGASAEAQLTKYGYDRASFVQALTFVMQQQFELNNRIRN